ncbi:hypothetical protein WKI65_28535 [Streptomyces sp. MS1.AVA.3]|uniref:hypothetical protein n=1 Tax=Streptomyces decoyicus TaxID=249567 RepID=UPI0030C0B1B0
MAESTEESAEGGWRLYPHLLLRRAGFSIDVLMDLADPAVEVAADCYRARVGRLEELREQALASLRDEVDEAAKAQDRHRLRLLSKVRGRVGRRRPLAEADAAVARDATSAYTAALRSEEEAWELLRTALEGERAARTGRVRRALANERVQDALVQLAPSFASEVERWSAAPVRVRTNAKDRAFLRRAYLYCQRLGAKNETTSFFGPLIHGSVTPDAEAIELSAETPSGVVETEAFLAFWAVCALARTMADGPLAGRFAVSWVPACRYDEDGLTLPDGRRAAVSATQRQMLDLVDGVRTPADIARITGFGDAAVTAQLDRLQRAGAVRCRPEPPSTTPRPLDWLIALADRTAVDTDWPDRLRRLHGLAVLYGEATGPAKRQAALEALETAFHAATGAETRRAAGQMYADRMVVSVDAKGDQGPVRVSTETAAEWERELTPVLEVAAQYGELLQSACAELCADLLREAGVTKMPYDELIRLSQAAVEQGRLAAYTGPADTFAADLTAMVAKACRSGDGRPPRAVLDAAALAAFRSPSVRSRFVSPDVMLESGQGERTGLVLGELHPYVFAWGSQGLFDDEQEQTLAAFADHLEPWGGPQQLATVIRRRRHKGLVAEWFPGRFIEITALATEERDRTLAVTDLVVELVDDRARLLSREGELVLYAGEDDHVHLRAFAAPTAVLPPVRLGEVMPRWSVGNLIAQRARWWVTAEELGTAERRPSDEVFRTVQRLRMRLALPRHVFAHVPGEPKPVGIDLDSPLAVEALAALVTSANTGRLALTEMRPAPDQLWLRRQGRPVTSEFRLALRWEMQ